MLTHNLSPQVLVENVRPEMPTWMTDCLQEVGKMHSAQTYGKFPYVYHLTQVTCMFYCITRNEVPLDYILAAMLHDSVEDSVFSLCVGNTEAQLAWVHHEWGLVTGSAVDFLTRRQEETYDDYFLRLKDADWPVLLIKWCDVYCNSHPDNLTDLSPERAEKLRSKYDGKLNALKEMLYSKFDVPWGVLNNINTLTTE